MSQVHEVLHSTNLNGKYQPGSMSLEWVVGEVDPQPGERPNKHPRRGLGDEVRVADVVILEGKLVTTVFEIKSDRGRVSQNKEQMAGLLQRGQAAILGIVLVPGAFHLNLFVANRHQKIICHHILKDISLERDVEGGLMKLREHVSALSEHALRSLLVHGALESLRQHGYI